MRDASPARNESGEASHFRAGQESIFALHAQPPRPGVGSAAAIAPEEGTVEEQFTVSQVVQVAVEAEARGAKLYRDLATRFTVEAEGREAQFRALQSKLPAGKQGVLGTEQTQYLRAVATAERLLAGSGLTAQSERIGSTKEALERAYALERATLLYYNGMRDTLGRSEVLDAIIEAEKGHLSQVMRYLVTGAKMRGLSDPW
jgi:rubrerythrin